MNVEELLLNPKMRGLKPSSLKAYCMLFIKSGESKVLNRFSICGQAKEWEDDKSLNLITSKDTLRLILTELEEAKLIKLDLVKMKLKII